MAAVGEECRRAGGRSGGHGVRCGEVVGVGRRGVWAPSPAQSKSPKSRHLEELSDGPSSAKASRILEGTPTLDRRGAADSSTLPSPQTPRPRGGPPPVPGDELSPGSEEARAPRAGDDFSPGVRAGLPPGFPDEFSPGLSSPDGNEFSPTSALQRGSSSTGAEAREPPASRGGRLGSRHAQGVACLQGDVDEERAATSESASRQCPKLSMGARPMSRLRGQGRIAGGA